MEFALLGAVKNRVLLSCLPRTGALEESRDRFVDFYEFAPVGYLRSPIRPLFASADPMDYYERPRINIEGDQPAMGIEDQFSTWAALFVSSYNDSKLGTAPAPITSGVQYLGVTPAARELLRSVDAGGVPAFVTTNLKLIATENGIDVPLDWTPNEIVDAIREKATIDESASSAPAE